VASTRAAGVVLREDVLADLGLGVGETASRLGISRVALSRVPHEHPVDPARERF
jgi:plasmid maintenance system antidote protein VapI